MGTHKDTLLLPQTTLPIKADLPANEPAVYKAWNESDLIRRMRRDGDNPFILHDGPPYANGDIHIGHALNKILKDFAVKVQYFNGRGVEFVPGWDCHGLPIEQKARQLHPESRDEYGLRQMCRQYASQQIDIQREQFKALGVIADWEHPYTTMDRSFESMVYNRLCELLGKEMLIQGKKPVFWSWAEQTALAEAEVEYKDRTDPSIYVVFPTQEATFPGGFLVWTTTPWTLPANVAVALHPDLDYVPVKFKDYPWPLVVAENLVEELAAKGIVEGKHWVSKYKGKDFLGWKLKHPINGTVSVVINADFVKADTGTGCVHIAPGHGEDDYFVARSYGLPLVMPVGPDGKYTEGKYAGHFVFDANKQIPEDLKTKGLLLHEEKITHSYPHCWRSDTPVIYRATPQLFLDLSKIRESVLKEFAAVEFLPEASKNRMKPMLESRPDWCLSRQRMWGVPIAFVRNKEQGVFSSHPDVVRYTQRMLQEEGIDVWCRKMVEECQPPSWYGAMFVGLTSQYFEKCTDILDVWFDSGLTWNTLNGRQADVYLEGNDQHRGWFQSSLWLSVALTGKAPYKKVITHGFVVDQNGEKMSKRKGNVVDPNDVVRKYGAEVLRYWAASIDYTKDMTCGEDIMKRCAEGHKKLRNTFRFLIANMIEPAGDMEGQYLPVDRWILDKACQVFTEVHDAFEKYEYYKGLHKLTEFVNTDLNAIYFNAVKDRLYCDGKNSFVRNSANVTMILLAEGLLSLVAPLFTYTAHEVFQHAPDFFKLGRKDIFDVTYVQPVPLPKYDFVEYLDEEYWKAALNAFHVEFDKLKAAGQVRDTLEVNIELKAGASHHFFAKAEDWFVVSDVTGMPTDGEPLAEFMAMGDTYRIVRARQGKCDRCWKRKAEGNLCLRCRKVLEETWTSACKVKSDLQPDQNVVESSPEKQT
jgi:isoleucyl-tRNA synthetase